MWSMPLMPHMSPAAIGCSVVMLRGWPERLEAPADRREHRVGAAEARGGRDGDGRAVGDQGGGLVGREDLWECHRQIPGSTLVSRPVRAASSAARASAIDLTPSSPVAAGRPLPAIASWKARALRR